MRLELQSSEVLSEVSSDWLLSVPSLKMESGSTSVSVSATLSGLPWEKRSETE